MLDKRFQKKIINLGKLKKHSETGNYSNPSQLKLKIGYMLNNYTVNKITNAKKQLPSKLEMCWVWWVIGTIHNQMEQMH
jgi:hypothetical protein